MITFSASLLYFFWTELMVPSQVLDKVIFPTKPVVATMKLAIEAREFRQCTAVGMYMPGQDIFP